MRHPAVALTAPVNPTQHIRTAIESALLLHPELTIVAVDLTVTDIHLRRTGQESS
jgi:hypothetical protein